MTKKTLYIIFHALFLTVFGIIFIGSLFDNQSVFHFANPVYQIISMVVILLIWIFGFKFISRKEMTKRREILYAVILFGSLIVLQLLAIQLLSVNPSWDFGRVYDGAYAVVMDLPDKSALNYIRDYPINKFYFYSLTSVMEFASWFGISNFRLVGSLFNLCMIDMAIVGLYFIVRKVWGSKLSVMTLFICLFITPLFGYVPIFYTDTLSMVFPIMLLLCYVYLPKEKKWSKKAVLLLILMGLISVLGMKMKATTLIILFAIFIHMFISYDRKIWLKYIGVIGLMFVVFYGGYTFIDSKVTFFPFNHMKPGRMPPTHYIMMGSSKYKIDRVPGRYWYGSYYKEDADLTYSVPANQRVKLNMTVWKQRMNDYGFGGGLDFIYHKAVQTWGEGSYYFPEKVSREAITERNVFSEIFFPDGKYFSVFFYASQGVQLAMLFGILYSAVIAFKKREWDIDSIARVSMFGLAIILTVWETRSRYIVNYIPIFIIATIPMLLSIQNHYQRSKKI